MQRGNLAVRQNHGVPPSTMTLCDDYFVYMIIKISLCRHYISSSEGLKLINSLIKGTYIEDKAKEHILENFHVSDTYNYTIMLGNC